MEKKNLYQQPNQQKQSEADCYSSPLLQTVEEQEKTWLVDNLQALSSYSWRAPCYGFCIVMQIPHLHYSWLS